VDYGFNLAASFQPDLLRDEKVVWAGQPDARFHFSSEDLFLVPASLLWGGLAILWEAAVFGFWGGKGPVPWFFVLWGIPFVLVGQYLIWGRFVYKMYKNRRTFYALTNQRALILSTIRSRQLQAFFLNQLPTINKTTRRDGSGTLEFPRRDGRGALNFGFLPKWAAVALASSDMDFSYGWSGPTAPAFCDIPDVEGVYQLIMRLRTDLQQTA
jgi:hypothetical protein